eukprot:scpid83305/ scgid35609/ 
MSINVRVLAMGKIRHKHAAQIAKVCKQQHVTACHLFAVGQMRGSLPSLTSYRNISAVQKSNTTVSLYCRLYATGVSAPKAWRSRWYLAFWNETGKMSVQI